LSLGGTAQRLYITGNDFSTNGWAYTAGLNVDYPVFDGWFLRNAELRARAVADTAQAEVAIQEQNVIAQVWNSYYALLTAAQRVEASNDLLQSAERSYAAALASYEAGIGDVIQLLQAQSTLANARAQQVRAKTSWYLSLAQLAHDTGTLDTTNISGGVPRSVP
jgi:outer membrane protein